MIVSPGDRQDFECGSGDGVKSLAVGSQLLEQVSLCIAEGNEDCLEKRTGGDDIFEGAASYRERPFTSGVSFHAEVLMKLVIGQVGRKVRHGLRDDLLQLTSGVRGYVEITKILFLYVNVLLDLQEALPGRWS